MATIPKDLLKLGVTFTRCNECERAEVVRCKDCKGRVSWYRNDFGSAVCGWSGLIVVDDISFCSHGEKMDAEVEE